MGFGATAQAQTEVWSGTLTVKDLGNLLGCSNAIEGARCRDTAILTDDDFTYDNTDYAVHNLFRHVGPAGRLEISFIPDLATAAQALTLDVAGTKFAFEDADVKEERRRVWASTGLSWSVGDAVAVKLTETPTSTNNAPIFAEGSSTKRRVAENTAAITNIGVVVAARDADSGDTLEYTLGGTDAASFAIVSASGQLQTSAALDFETKSSYAVEVSVSDGNGGSASIDVTIIVTDVAEKPATPAAPTVSATANSDTSLDVSWTAPDLNGGPAITGYNLQYRQGTSGDFTDGPQNVSGTSTAITGLTAGTSYQVQVRALNGETPSDWSPAGTGSTSSAPNNAPAFTEGASATRTVAENTASGQDIGTAVGATDADSGDTLEYTLGGTDAASFSIVSASGQLQTSGALDFETKSSYAVTVSVADGNGGSASIGVTITVTDVAEKPATPGAPTVSATANSNTSLDVSWTAPGLNGGPALTGYNLQYRPGTSGDFTDGPQNVSGTSTAITGLTAGTSYQVQVRALNGETPSDWSPAGTGSTSSAPATAPGVPRSLAAAPGDGEVVLRWTAPASDGGETITRYEYRSKATSSLPFVSSDSWTSAGTALTATVGSLTNGTPYSFEVRAVNTVGAGTAATTSATPMATATAPGIRVSTTMLSVEEGDFRGNSYTVRLDTQPTGNVTVTITGQAGTNLTVISSPLTFTSTDWNQEQTVQLGAATDNNPAEETVTLRHAATGGGYDSVAPVEVRVTITQPDTAPGVPRTLAAAPGDGQVVLRWTAPASDGGETITRYEYRSKATSSLPFVSSDSWTSAGTALTATVGSLTNGTPYSFEVRAANTVGAGTAATTSATPMATARGTQPTLTLAAGPNRIGEAAGSVQICVVPSAPSTQRITVQVATADGTATAPGDYVSYSSTVALQPQQQRACFTVTLVDDAEAEGDETFTVRLSNPVNATLGGARAVATFTIVDDDGTDRDVLVAFYNATGGANWTVNTNWLSNEALSAWHGVTTDADGRVTDLLFYDNQLTGTIPTQLGQLTKLQYLNLNNNELSGTIPTELRRLTKLTGLDLGNNRLTGTIPTQLGQLTELRYLNLHDNQLTGTIPTQLGQLTKLTALYLDSNELSGEIPAELGSLTNLQRLRLQNNQLTGPLPLTLSALSQLLVLNIQSTTLCAPTDTAFQAWLATINFQGSVCGSGGGGGGGPATSAPSAPSNLTAVGGDGEVVLSWEAPTSDGGTAITDYEYRIDGKDPWISTGSTATTHTVAGLDNGTEYTFEVRAVNVAGAGEVAEVSARLNRPPAFTRSTWSFELPENRDGSGQPVELGAVTAEDPDGDALTYGLASGDRARFAVGARDGVLTYTGPGEDYETEPNRYGLEVWVRDEAGAEAEARVAVTVTPVNDAPAAVDDEAHTEEDREVVIAVLANDTDPEGDPLEVETVSAAAHGATRITAEGGVAYTPEPDYHGVDGFTYVVSDGAGETATGTVTVTVTAANDAPVAVGVIPDQVVEEGGGAAAVDVTPFFDDIDGDALTFRAVSSDAAVAAVTLSGAVLTVTPVAAGAAAVTVTATDPGGLTGTQTFGVGVGDRLVRAVLEETLAAMARSHLASARMTLGRRVGAGRADTQSRLTAMGRSVPLGKAAVREAAERLLASWAGSRYLSGGGLAEAGRTVERQLTGWAASEAHGPGGPGTPPDPAASLGLNGLGGFGSVAGGGGDAPMGGTEFVFAWGGGKDGSQQAGGGRGWQLWGQGDIQTFVGEPEAERRYEGDVRTGYVGLDRALGERWLAGVAVSRSEDAGDWRVGSARGHFAGELTAVHPYLRWSDGATSVWTMAGGGWGTAENARAGSGAVGTSGLDLRLGLFEVRRRLADWFGLRADAAWAQLKTEAGEDAVDGQSVAVDQQRFGFEFSPSMRLGGLTLEPFGEAAARRDGGAGQTGTGLEVSGGLRAVGGPVRIDAQGRILVLHSATGYEERGAGVTLSIGGQSPEGLSLSVSPRWGGPAAGTGALWREQVHESRQPVRADREPWTLDARGEYALRLPGGRLFTWVGSFNRSALGNRLTLGGQLGTVADALPPARH